MATHPYKQIKVRIYKAILNIHHIFDTDQSNMKCCTVKMGKCWLAIPIFLTKQEQAADLPPPTFLNTKSKQWARHNH